VPPLYLTYLNALDVAALALSDDEILAAIEAALAAQGRGETVIEPRMHLIPDKGVHGHFNVLRGAIRSPANVAGVKVIGDYVDNYQQGLPSELGLLLLMDATNGVPKAIIDGSHLTDMRTGAGHRDRREISRPQGIEDPRPYRRARHRLLERAPARSSVSLR